MTPDTKDLSPRVAVRAKVTGFVEQVRIDRGSLVKEGELLATLEAPELTAGDEPDETAASIAEATLAPSPVIAAPGIAAPTVPAQGAPASGDANRKRRRRRRGGGRGSSTPPPATPPIAGPSGD